MIHGYLDNAATTEPKYFSKDYYMLGNPNSQHALGVVVSRDLDDAKERIKRCLGVKGGKVLFCRCASEAVEKLAESFRGDIACSTYEHDSVWEACNGCTIPFNNYPKYLKYMKDFKLKSFLYLHQYVNNITGTIFDIKSIGKMCRDNGAFFGSDFTAAIGHVFIPENLESFCDCVWFSGHKFHAEQGVGAIWLSNRLVNYFGEDCVDEMFEGTPNVAGAVAMSWAMDASIDYYNRYKMSEQYESLYTSLMNNLLRLGIEAYDWVTKGDKSYAINAITLPGFNADALVQFLSSRGVYISAGHSACSDNQDYHVLEAFGFTKEEAEQTIRVSFCEDTSVRDIDMLVNGIVEFRDKFM